MCWRMHNIHTIEQKKIEFDMERPQEDYGNGPEPSLSLLAFLVDRVGRPLSVHVPTLRTCALPVA